MSHYTMKIRNPRTGNVEESGMMDPIQVAARAICEADPLSPAPDASIIWGGKLAKAWEPRAAILRQAVDAGLFCYPPKAWLAPWEITWPMINATYDMLAGGDMSGSVWAEMRDAHTKEQT